MNTLPEHFLKRHHEWIKVVNDRNLAGYVNLLKEDGIWIPPGQEPLIGREAFKSWLKPFFDQFRYNFTVKNERFRMAGNRVVEKGSFETVMTPENDGEPMAHSGTFTILWHRDEDRNWCIEFYIDDTGL